jgi:hypothetical protein
MSIIVTVKAGGGSNRLIVEDRGGGLDIRPENAAFADADRSTPVDIDHGHCSGCRDGRSILEMLGLSNDEADILSRWRTRKQDGVSSKLLGEILDKVVKAIDLDDEFECTTYDETIVLQVESSDA